MVDHIIDVSESPQSPPNVFALATPQHLLMKLHWEISQHSAKLTIS